jgi:integrase
MPTRYPTKTGVQWRAVVKREGRVAATKLFPAGTEGKREAAQWERDTRKALMEGPKESLTTPTALPSVLDWANRYTTYAEKQFTRQTFTEKKTVFRLFLAFTKATKLETITPDVIMRYLQRQNDRRSGFAANKDRKNLAAAWEWGRKYLDGFPVVPNPFLGIPKFREVRKPRYVPREEDFWKVVKEAQGQDKVMLLAFFYLGARRGEIFRLKWEDVDFTRNRVRLGTCKTNDGSMRYDWIPLAADLRAALADWQQARPYKTPWVFTCLNDSPSPWHNPGEAYRARGHFMKNMCERAGVKPFGFHAIRHLHASILFNEGSELSVVQRQLRHTNPNTTARYLRSLGYEEEHGQKVLAVMEGRGPVKTLNFAEKKESPDIVIRRLGTQSRYTEPGKLKATGA